MKTEDINFGGGHCNKNKTNNKPSQTATIKSSFAMNIEKAHGFVHKIQMRRKWVENAGVWTYNQPATAHREKK